MSRLLVAAASFVLGLITVVATLNWTDQRAAPRLRIDQPEQVQAITVEVVGAVATPGIYTLPSGSRYGDAVAAAGGFAPTADLSVVNVARLIGPSERVEIPFVQATVAPTFEAPVEPSPTEAPTRTAATNVPAAPALALVDINSATAEELDTLPGIGPVLARRIIEDREANGPFRSVDELERVRGISARMVDGLRPMITAK